MIGFWTYLGVRRSNRRWAARRREEQRLEEQAERQRLRAPEPGPANVPTETFEEESEIPILRASLYDYRKLRWGIGLLVLPLVLGGWLVNPWIFWLGLLPFFFSVGFIVDWWENL
jgi:hypothetical protein